LLYYTPPLQANILKSQIDNRLILDKNQSIELYPLLQFQFGFESSRLIVFLEFEISVGDIVIDIFIFRCRRRDNPENCLKLNNAFL
jgi:hypothetical protein